MALDVALALIGVYIAFALVASHVSEQISAILNKRGTYLLAGVKRLLLEDSDALKAAAPSSDQIVSYIYGHPLIGNLSPREGKLPSYIPSRAFSLSFLDSLRRIVVTDESGAPIDAPALTASPDALFSDLVARVSGLPPCGLKTSLVILVRNAEQSYDRLLREVDSWFESEMDRVSGWYKRWSASTLAVIAAVLVVAFNVDTFGLILQVSRSSELRTIAANAALHLSADSDPVSTLRTTLDTLSFGWSTLPQGAGAVLLKLFGFILSWFAVMLGAPFWFDLLGRIVPVRLAGAKPATATASTQDASGANLK